MSRALQDRIEELEEEVRQLREAFAPRIAFPEAWKLKPRDSGILSAIYAARGSWITPEAILLWCEGPATLAIDIHVRKWIAILRDKVEPHGVAIAYQFGRGFALTPAGRVAVAKAIGDEVPIAPAESAAHAHPRGWTEAEDAIVRAGYERGATLAIIRIELLAAGHRARSFGSISTQAQKLGLTAESKGRLWRADEDALLREDYADGEPIAAIRTRLARAGFRRSRGAIQMRAINLGLTSDRVRRWSSREVEIARAGLAAGKRHRVILEELRTAGFDRGLTALCKFAQLHNLTRVSDPWSETESAVLRERYAARVPVRDIARELGRTPAAIASWASRLGLKQRVPWSAEERRLLVAASESGARLTEAAERIGRPYPNVAQEAVRMGLSFRRQRPAIAAE